jgi:hypothetical protein
MVVRSTKLLSSKSPLYSLCHWEYDVMKPDFRQEGGTLKLNVNLGYAMSVLERNVTSFAVWLQAARTAYIFKVVQCQLGLPK